MDEGTSQAEQRIALTELDRVVLEPVLSPMPTVVEAVRDVMSDRPPCVLTRWQRQRVRDALVQGGIRALSAFRPTLAPSDGGPNPLMHAAAGASMDEELERLATTDPDKLGEVIETATESGRPTQPWRVVHRDPHTWLGDYLRAVRLVWAEVEPLWLSASGSLDREVERLQAACEKSSGSAVIREAEMPGKLEAGHLALPSHTHQSGHLRIGVSLQLVPLLAAPPAGGWLDDYSDLLVNLRYPLPPRMHQRRSSTAAPESLEALLGTPRATILLALDEPKHPGQLAQQLFLAASGVTHHLDALEASRLVTRRRDGRYVWANRTARGTALLELYHRE